MANRRKLPLLMALFALPGLLLAACEPVVDHPIRVTLAPFTDEPIPTSTPTAVPNDEPITLYINWEKEPVTLDPALATDKAAINVIRNLFVGLTQFDPETGAVLPYLATSWEAGWDDGGRQTWTFHLREDVPWVHYNPSSGGTTQVTDEDEKPLFVSAQDVEYGVKRALDPDTGAEYAYNLYVIHNAEEVNKGEVGFGLNDVGVRALNASTIQFTLEDPAGYFPAIVGVWTSYPVPAAAIEEWGVKWTEAGLIVTNGPYVLEEWVHGHELNLVKNPLWVDFDEVQIERVQGWIIDEYSSPRGADYSLYENNKLDSVDITGAIACIHCLDNLNRAEKIIGTPIPCTYYYGFTNNKPPMDDVRVRRAFSAAIDRNLLIEVVTKGGQFPATSFAPPGIFGAPEPGKVGQDFDPDLAVDSLQAYLDEKGVTIEDFNALDITLMHNTSEGHANIAAAIQQMWKDNLGVEVIIEDQDWDEYLETLKNNTPIEEMPHIWRLGWCADYPDEHNWVYEVFHYEGSENRLRRNCLDANCLHMGDPSRFDNLTSQAALETDPGTRAALYAEAEHELASVEVAYAPIYYYGYYTLSHPWLTRNYPIYDGYDIFNWRIDWEMRPAITE